MAIHTDIVVAGGYGGGYHARAGQYITVVDLEGVQAGDFVALCADDPSEYLSAPHCREALLSLFPRVGDKLVTNRRRPILEIVNDKVGTHDMTIPACDPTRYSVEFGVPGHRNCLENMLEGLRGRGLEVLLGRAVDGLDVPEPLNLFQNTPVVADGRVGIAEGTSQPDGLIVFRALLNVIGALSSCPQDMIPSNGLRPSPLRLIVADEPVLEV